MHIQLLLHHYGYMGVFFILFMENVGLPFPAETTLILSGIAWTHGVFQIIPLVLIASMGNILGSTVAYALGRFLGRPVIVHFGKYIGITNERLNKGNDIFAKYQLYAVLFGKFIAGIRVLIPYLAGINKVSFVIFSIYNAISAFLWTLTFIFFGKYIGLWWSHYHHLLHQYMVPIIILLAVLVSVFIAWKIRRHRQFSQVEMKQAESSYPE